MNSDRLPGVYNADLVSEVVFVETIGKDGERKRIPVTKRRIELSASGKPTIAFGVGKGANGQPVIGDKRMTVTGATQETNRGPLPGPTYCKPGHEVKQTPTAWFAENERLVKPSELNKLAVALHAAFAG